MNKDVMSLVNQYQSVKGQRKSGEKRGSAVKYENQAVPAVEDMHVSQKAIDQILQINEQTQIELNRVDQVEFNIFNVRKSTMENELVTVITYLLHKEQLFSALNINMDIFMRFINKI